MLHENIKKTLSLFVITAYMVIYSAPVGLCISSVEKSENNKPVLRESSQSFSLKLEGDICISKKNPKVTLSLRDSDVKQVLRMFADKAGLNIIFHSSVDDASASGGSQSSPSSLGGTNTSSGKKVTMDLVNVPLNDAFRMVMQVSDLTYYLDNNTLVIASASAAQQLNLAKQELMAIPVKYVDASTLANFLNKNIFSINKPGLSNAQIAVTNPGANEILIFGTKNDYLMAKKIVAQFDVKPLEETFVVNHTTPKEMAELLCSTLFSNSSEQQGSQNAVPASPSTNTQPAVVSPTTTPAQPTVAPNNPTTGIPTGGAASSDSSGSSGSSISLGAGVIACQYDNKVYTDNLASLNTKSLAITYFPQRGVISATGGSAQQMSLIRDFIAKNDKKQPQAYLEVSILELNETGSKEFSNTWNVYSSFFSGTFDGTTTTNSNYPTFFHGDNIGTTINRYSGTPTITYSLKYLIENGKGRILANPRIMITNGEMSKIDLSSDYVKTVTSQIITSSFSESPTVQKTYEIGDDEGIVIEIVPFISPEGYVTLNIKPQYSTEKAPVTSYNAETGENDLAATLLQRRNLELKNVRIKDGETLIIGGMMRETEQQTINKIPVLGDLPGVGMFFRNTISKKEKEELIIMLTPKIIKDSEDIVNQKDMML